MKARSLSFLILLLLLGIIGLALRTTGATTATSPMLPKPPSYPFDEAEKMAAEKLPIWLYSLRSAQDCMDYGFKDCDETQRALLGKPYISYSFNIQTMAQKSLLQGNLRDQLEGGVNIEFPVLVDGQARSLISVVFQKGRWLVGGYGGFQPTLIVHAQNVLASQGISERVDMIGMGKTLFGLLDYKGQAMLIPLEDREQRFPELDFSGTHMYPIEDITPLVHIQAQKMMVEYERAVRESQEREQQYKLTPTVFHPTQEIKPTAVYIPERVYPAPDIPTPTSFGPPPTNVLPTVPAAAGDADYPAP